MSLQPPKKSQEHNEESSLPTSKGEKLFDLLTYWGISFVGVFLATLPFAHSVKYGKGKKLYEGSMEAMQKVGLSKGASENIFNTTVLGMLGNVAVVPIKKLEDKKAQHVKTLNGLVGEKDDTSHVEHEPKQSWGSLIKSRFVSYGVVWASLQGTASLIGKEKFAAFENKFAEKFCAIIKKPTHRMVEVAGEGVKKLETKSFQYGKLAALDVFATLAATILLYAGSRFFAKKDEAKAAEPAPAAVARAPQEKPLAGAPPRLFADKAMLEKPKVSAKQNFAQFAVDNKAARTGELTA